MSDTSTSIGNGPSRGGNENRNADPRSKTMGEDAPADMPAVGADVVGEQTPLPAGVPGGAARPDVAKGAKAYPDGPNVAPSARELDAASGDGQKPPAAG